MNYYNYFTEIEEHFVRRRGKHLLVSPMDWGLIAAWRDAGIPLQVALRGIDIAMDHFFSKNTRGTSKINTLCYCHDSVMAEFAGYCESRVGGSRTDPETETAPSPAQSGSGTSGDEEISEAGRYLSAIIDEIKTLSGKQRLCESSIEGLARVQERLEEMLHLLQTGVSIEMESLERDLKIADEILAEALLACVSPAQVGEWEKEAKTELKVYRKKLPKEMYAKIHENFMRGRIHQEFNIREFSLFRL
jgi:hypothetical protein